MGYEDTFRSLKVKGDMVIGGTLTAPGFQGTPGAQGPQGVAGAQGAQGVSGAQGVIGVTGAQGSQGADGAQGAQGANGTPSPVNVPFSGTFPTVGGDVTEVISEPGVLVTDKVMVMVKTPGVSPTYVVAAACTADTITVTCAADPGNDAVLQYAVFR